MAHREGLHTRATHTHHTHVSQTCTPRAHEHIHCTHAHTYTHSLGTGDTKSPGGTVHRGCQGQGSHPGQSQDLACLPLCCAWAPQVPPRGWGSQVPPAASGNTLGRPGSACHSQP